MWLHAVTRSGKQFRAHFHKQSTLQPSFRTYSGHAIVERLDARTT